MGRLAWGGYLLFHSYPRLKVAFDGRITTYGAAIYHDIVGFLQGRKDEEVAAKYGFDLAIVQPYVFGFGKPREDPTFVAPDRSQNWVIVYRDEDLMREGAAVVALRRGSPLFEKNMERVRAAPPSEPRAAARHFPSSFLLVWVIRAWILFRASTISATGVPSTASASIASSAFPYIPFARSRARARRRPRARAHRRVRSKRLRDRAARPRASAASADSWDRRARDSRSARRRRRDPPRRRPTSLPSKGMARPQCRVGGSRSIELRARLRRGERKHRFLGFVVCLRRLLVALLEVCEAPNSVVPERHLIAERAIVGIGGCKLREDLEYRFMCSSASGDASAARAPHSWRRARGPAPSSTPWTPAPSPPAPSRGRPRRARARARDRSRSR